MAIGAQFLTKTIQNETHFPRVVCWRALVVCNGRIDFKYKCIVGSESKHIHFYTTNIFLYVKMLAPIHKYSPPSEEALPNQPLE